MKYRWASFLLLFFSLLSFQLFPKDIPKPPVPFRLVIDNAGLMSSDQVNDLETKLRNYDNASSTQIVVFTDVSLEGEDDFEYSQSIAQQWGVGQKDKNNGLFVYIAKQERKIRIQVGYGLEPVVTDAASKIIIEDIIKPAFRKGDFYQGLNSATDTLMALASREFSPSDFVKRNTGNTSGLGSKKIIGIIVLIIIILLFTRGRTGGFLGGFWMGSAFGSFSSGSGTFGGGGFSGGSFGGGSFGGGGAGGSW